MGRDTVVDRFKENARVHGAKTALYAQSTGGSGWKPVSWSQYWDRSRQFAAALMGLGFEPGASVVIMGNNCPEWVIADVGAMMVRGVPAGIYQTCTPEQVSYIATHCEAKVFVFEDETFWRERIEPALEELGCVAQFVAIRGADKIEDERVVSFQDFLTSGDAHLGDADARFQELDASDLATLIYTSGTTGPPKGVMLTHDNLAFTSGRAIELIGGVDANDCNVSYLPLSHIAEQMFTLHIPLTSGQTVYFCSDIKEIKEALTAARPTIFLAVPRVWEKFKTALEGPLSQATGVKAAIVDWSRAQGKSLGYKKLKSGPLGGLDAVKYNVADRLFFSKLKGRLGLDRLRVAVTGAAPIGLDVLEFFLSVGIPIHEVYGQSEDTGPTTFNRPGAGWTKLGTAGRPFPEIEVKIAEDGEILVKGRNVFEGYYKNPEATAETLIDGWLHSGDIGEFDSDGFLRITDRKKDLIITAGGKNVAPQNIEKLLRQIDGVGQAVVIGDRRKFLSALLTIDPDRAPGLAADRGWPQDLEALATHPDFMAHVQKGVDRANSDLARYENVRKTTILPLDFTVEGGELTPTQKIKRRVVNEKYNGEIEAFYAGLD